jgi:DNA-binding response OmpR family regulator
LFEKSDSYLNAGDTTIISVLLVDDDIELSAMLGEYLVQEGFRVRMAHDGETGLQAALSGHYALLVLDMMLPRLSGLEVLRTIRADEQRAQSQLPILMLTARGDDVDCIMGLELGADDFVAKPCSPRKLVARINAVLRRVQPAPAGMASAPLQAGPLQLWPGKRRAEWQGERLALTATEFNLLEVLVRHAGQVVGKQELSRLALGRPLERFDRSIDVHVSSIRQKLPLRADQQSWIQAVRGMGYVFVQE